MFILVALFTMLFTILSRSSHLIEFFFQFFAFRTCLPALIPNYRPITFLQKYELINSFFFIQFLSVSPKTNLSFNTFTYHLTSSHQIAGHPFSLPDHRISLPPTISIESPRPPATIHQRSRSQPQPIGCRPLPRCLEYQVDSQQSTASAQPDCR